MPLGCKGKHKWKNVYLQCKHASVKAAMFAHGTGVIADIDIWHKRIGHVNVQRKSMQTKNLVDGLPKFKVDGMHKVCEACQLGKQSRHAFPHDKHVSMRPLDVIHSDVWGPAQDCNYFWLQVLCDLH